MDTQEDHTSSFVVVLALFATVVVVQVGAILFYWGVM